MSQNIYNRYRLKFNLDHNHLMTLRLMLDTAALVLIWLVQRVIYPAFLHFRNEDFKRWHIAYTRRVTYVVMPIMLGQLALYSWLFFAGRSWDVVVNLMLVLAAWAITFFRAVPLHGALDVDDDHLPLSASLIAINWWRTGIWTAIWMITIYRLLV